MKTHAVRQLGCDLFKRLSVADAGKYVANIAGFDLLVHRLEHGDKRILRFLRSGRVRSIGPEGRGGIADLDAVAASFGEERIERGGVTKRRYLGDRGIIALIVLIRGKGFLVKRDERSARRLGAPTAFDRRMQARNRTVLAGDETCGDIRLSG